MKRIALALMLLPSLVFAQTPAQQLAGQLATALAAANDRIGDLEKQVAALKAEAAKPPPEAPK